MVKKHFQNLTEQKNVYNHDYCFNLIRHTMDTWFDLKQYFALFQFTGISTFQAENSSNTIPVLCLLI